MLNCNLDACTHRTPRPQRWTPARRVRRYSLLYSILATLSLTPYLHADETSPLNVVLIVADDLGWTDLQSYGSDLHKTPHLDRLASQSVRFTQAYSSASICSPTRAALMTGKYPARLGMTIWHEGAFSGPRTRGKLTTASSEWNLAREEQTLAEILRGEGYATFHVGKWHLGDAAHFPETQGFDVNIGGTHWGAPSTFFHPFRGPFGDELRYIPDIPGGRPGDYLTDRLTDEAIHLIESNREKPFYLNLWYHTVHTPIEGKPELVAQYEEPAKTAKHHRHATYAAMVHSLDENVGRVLAKLQELDLMDRTLIIFTSDNGGVVHRTRWGTVTNNAPLRSGKGSLYEGGIRIPLLIRDPHGERQPKVCEQIVLSQDLFPTILDRVGSKTERINQTGDSISLLPQLQRPEAMLDRKSVFWHYPHFYPTTTPVSAVRRGDHKLLYFYEDDRIELYDLKSDPGETDNLALEKKRLAEQLTVELQTWLKKVGARLPQKTP